MGNLFYDEQPRERGVIRLTSDLAVDTRFRMRNGGVVSFRRYERYYVGKGYPWQFRCVDGGIGRFNLLDGLFYEDGHFEESGETSPYDLVEHIDNG